MKAGLKQVHADLAASTPGTPVTEADLTWAIQAVRSRAFSGPYAGKTLCMPPGIMYLCYIMCERRPCKPCHSAELVECAYQLRLCTCKLVSYWLTLGRL